MLLQGHRAAGAAAHRQHVNEGLPPLNMLASRARFRAERPHLLHQAGDHAKAFASSATTTTSETWTSNAYIQTPAEPQHSEAQLEAVVRRFYNALNLRDMAGLFQQLDPSCSYVNLAVAEPQSGRQAISEFYLDAIRAVPEGATFVVDDITAGPASRKVAASWSLLLPGSAQPLSKGLSFFVLSPLLAITSLTDAPEYLVKVNAGTISAASPFIRSMGPLVVPAVKDLSQMVSSGGSVDLVNALPDVLGQLVNMLPGGTMFGAELPRLPDFSMPGSSSGSSSSSYSSSPAGSSTVTVSYDSLDESSSSFTPTSSTTTSMDAGPAASASYSYSNGNGTASRASTSSSDPPSSPPPAQPPSSSSPSTSASASTTGSSQGPATQAAPQEPEPPAPVDLSGLWVKDAAKSDGPAYEKSLEVLQLSTMQRVTARLIEGIDMTQRGDIFDVAFVTIVPFFRVTESLRFSRACQIGRRDLRSGRANATATKTSTGVVVQMSWGAPLAGSLTEEYVLQPGGTEMHVTSTMEVAGKEAKALLVYRRSGMTRQQLLDDSRKRNNSLQDVMKKQGEA